MATLSTFSNITAVWVTQQGTAVDSNQASSTTCFGYNSKWQNNSLDTLQDSLQNNSQVLTELIHLRLIKPLIRTHPSTKQLNLVGGSYWLPLGFPIQSRIKVSADNDNQTKTKAIHTSCDFTWQDEEERRGKESLGNIVQRFIKIIPNCTHEYHSCTMAQPFFKHLPVLLGNILHYRFKRGRRIIHKVPACMQIMRTHAKTFQRCKVSSEDVVKYANICIALLPQIRLSKKWLAKTWDSC